MAFPAPSPLASSLEKTNGAKLSRLLVDGGTTILRKIFDGFHPPANLDADLKASYPILLDLYSKQILNGCQWDKLFPPGGAAPNSKHFDITLLFLLLTNICGLSRPRRGWNTEPHPRDPSCVANLVRIKLYRNELYGHVTTTGVDTATFSRLWGKISAPLVALGLNPAEIGRLKAECGGEENYLQLLCNWAESDKNIRTQLKNIRHSLSEIQQTLEKTQQAVKEVHQTQTKAQLIFGEVRQNQMEDHGTLLDSNAKLEEVRQKQTKTQQTVDVVNQTQMEDREKIQNIKPELKELRQTQSKAQQILQEVRQTQMEDHGTLQDSNSELKEVCHTLTKTHQTVEEVHHTLKEDRETLERSKSKMNEVHQSQTKTQHTMEEVAACLQEIKEDVSSLKDGREKNKLDEVLCYLAKSEFKGDIEYHVQRFQEDTREWVFTRVQNWLDDRNSQNRVMVISGNAGMGKSVIAAVICKRMQEAGRLSGCHFCQHNNSRYRNPKLMLQSLACHLSHTLPEYKQALLETLSRNLGGDLNDMGVEELFALLFKEPLSTVGNPGRNMLMVIDGVDESTYQGRNELLDVIVKQFCKLPSWIRFVVTTRPAMNITEKLKHLKPFELESDDEKNVEDVRAVLKKRLQHVITQENVDNVVEKLVVKSEGLMLFAHFLVLYIEQNPSVLDVLDKADLGCSLPLRLTSVYESYFMRLEGELVMEVGVKGDNFYDLLCAIVASREPLPTDFVTKLLMPSRNPTVAAKRKVIKAISSVSSLLPIRDGCLHVIHKSVKDWLMDSSCYGEHYFTMNEKEGHRLLADLCIGELDNIKWRGVVNAKFSSSEKYALCHGVRHRYQSDEERGPHRMEELIKAYVIDLELLYACLLVNNTRAAEDLLWLKSLETFTELSEDVQIVINTLLLLLRKHRYRLSSDPSVFFQTVLNEGGTVPSSEASNLLQNKYVEKAFAEYVHKEPWYGGVLARFECSSSVACLDVTPKLDYMVCECMDGILQLWSLETGRLLWKRPVLVPKSYFDGFEAFRKVSSSSVLTFYRSVVFYPAEIIVLPGMLSYAYTIGGDLIPLFSESKCKFSVCSISRDKTKILTDCPGNAKCLVMWSLKNGSEISRVTRDEDVLSFAWSQGGRLLIISHCTGLICLVDVISNFTTLAQTSTSEVCGMLKFSPNHRDLLCLHSLCPSSKPALFRFQVREQNHKFSLHVSSGELSSDARDSASFSDCGFLFGDPVFRSSKRLSSDRFVSRSTLTTIDFVLNKQFLLRTDPSRSHIKMFNIDEADRVAKASGLVVRNIALSLDGHTVYVLSGTIVSSVMAWDVSSGELLEQKCSGIGFSSCIVPVREGVLLTTTTNDTSTLELWTSDLSDCIRTVTNLPGIQEMIPISEELLVCFKSRAEVNILDTTRLEIVARIGVSSDRGVLACNSKFQLLTIDNFGSFQLSNGTAVLWEKASVGKRLRFIDVGGLFSPAENFVVIWTREDNYHDPLYVLDAVSGTTLHALRDVRAYRDDVNDCMFVSGEECVVCRQHGSIVYLQLYNVKAGEILSVLDDYAYESRACLAACRSNHTIAIALSSPSDFRVIQVWLPGDKVGWKIGERIKMGIKQREEEKQKINESCVLV